MDSGKVGSFENLALRSRYMMLMVLTPGGVDDRNFWLLARSPLQFVRLYFGFGASGFGWSNKRSFGVLTPSNPKHRVRGIGLRLARRQ